MELSGVVKINAGKVIPISMICPHCGSMGTFASQSAMGTHDGISKYSVVHRFCPDPDCRGFVITFDDFGTGEMIDSYPKVKIDFDTEEVPERIVESLEEAIECESIGCYTAAAIMVRKTLEIICEENGAKGNNLYKRIENLADTIIIPHALKEALQNLRLLGNDAAHVMAKTFSEIGDEEVEISILLTKEILKALYQHQELVNRLKSLKIQGGDAT